MQNKIYIAILLTLAILAMPMIAKADIVRDCGAVNTTAPADYIRVSFCVDDKSECPQFTVPPGVPVTQGIAVACTVNGSGEVILYQIDPSPATPTPEPTPTQAPTPTQTQAPTPTQAPTSEPMPYPGPESLGQPISRLQIRVFIPVVGFGRAKR